MNAKQWRQAGFKTIFRDGQVYLYLIAAGITYATKVDRGEWMDRGIQAFDVPELDAATRADIEAAIAACYCDNGVGTCDFCAGIRTSDSVR